MISKVLSNCVKSDGVFVVIFFKTLYNCFCDIPNNQGLGECYQPPSSARLTTPTSTLFNPDISPKLKTSSNNCLNSLILSWKSSFSQGACFFSPLVSSQECSSQLHPCER